MTLHNERLIADAWAGIQGHARTRKEDEGMKKRDLSSEIAEGFEALAEAREGNRTLRTHTMSIYRRYDELPEWEPHPWDMQGAAVDTQELGFHERAIKPISWMRVSWNEFPLSGIFGHDREWFSSNDIAFYATFDSEDLILIQNIWHGFPDPPEWGLASRPADEINVPWSHWGHFPDLPGIWEMPEAM